MEIKINKPSENEVNKYLKRWDSLETYTLQESSLRKLFTKTYPKNENMDDILIKVCSLNDFYSTNIFSPFKVAKHIFSLKIDARLPKGDEKLVNEIANIKVAKNRSINFYSFATKYCSHHQPLLYPIYDNYVIKVLSYFKKLDKFSNFTLKELKNYPKFKKVILDFKTFYNLDKFNLKEIDMYLWQVGKEKFPRKYIKKGTK